VMLELIFNTWVAQAPYQEEFPEQQKHYSL
jgi:hypothetical protein